MHLADDEVQDVAVVDEDGKLVSVCTRHDLLTARLALLDHERPEPGWLARRAGRNGNGDGRAGPEVEAR